MTTEANRRVCRSLSSFVSSRLSEYPTNERLFTLARDSLYAYFFCAGIAVSKKLDGDLAKYKDKLFALNATQFLFLLSSLHTAIEVTNYLEHKDDRLRRSLFFLATEGICDIYGRPDSYMKSWYEKLEWLGESKNNSMMRIALRAYEEIAPILGTPAMSFPDAMLWIMLSFEIAKVAQNTFKKPDWHGTVDAEIAESLK